MSKPYAVTFYGTATVYVNAYDEDDAFELAQDKLDEGDFSVDYSNCTINREYDEW